MYITIVCYSLQLQDPLRYVILNFYSQESQIRIFPAILNGNEGIFTPVNTESRAIWKTCAMLVVFSCSDSITCNNNRTCNRRGSQDYNLSPDISTFSNSIHTNIYKLIMRIMITDSKGESISITIGDNGSFKELNKEMERIPQVNSELDANVLSRLSNNNRPAKTSLSKVTDSSLELLEAKVKNSCLNEIETESKCNSVSKKEQERRGKSQLDRMKIMEEKTTVRGLGIGEARVSLAILSDNEAAENSESSNTQSLCRLCASQSDDLVYMFGTDCEPYKNIIEKIEDCLPIMVTKSDTLPKEACRSCLEKLELCHKFYETVSDAEKRFLILGGKTSYESEEATKYCETMSSKKDVRPSSLSPKEESYSVANTISEEEDERMSGNNWRIKCQICGVAFDTVKNCQTHSRIHITENYYPCSLCDEIYTVEKDWIEHTVDHDTEGRGESVKKQESEEEPVCKKCGNKLDLESDYCESCDKTLDSEQTLYVHLQTANDRTDNEFSCDICGKQFRAQASVNAHQRIHRFVQGRSFMCEICNKRFYSEDSLEMHKVTHAKEKSSENTYTCYYCGKIFAQKGNLEIHIRSHTEAPREGEKKPFSKTRPEQIDRPFKCIVCEKRFDHSARLREHSRVHTGKRPYDCTICNKSFKRASARKVHMIIHSDEKPFHCQLCGSNFRRAGDLRRHIKTQHNQK